jgi:hypothetical protein
MRLHGNNRLHGNGKKQHMNTRTIDTLLEIMADPHLFTRRRVEAAEAILGFESPADAVARAREFLAGVFENSDEDIADRMEAAQITRKFEAKKIAPQTVHLTRREETDRREAWREYECMRRRTRLILAAREIPPPGWDDDLRSPDYLPPPGDDNWPPAGGLKKRDG